MTEPPAFRSEPATRPLRNVADLVRSAAARSGERAALLSSGPTRTWAQVDAAVDAGVADLARFGLGVGERVVVALPSGPDLVVTLLALARAGLVAVPIGPDRRDVGAVADLVGAAAAIAPDRGHWLPIAIDAPRVAQWWDRTAPPAPAVAGGEDLVWLARAGRGPRPVMISHRAILAGSAAVPALPGLALTGDDRVLQLLPLHHLAGWVTSFLPLAVVGGAAVHPDPAPPPSPVASGADPHPARGPARAGLAATVRHRATVLPTTPGLCHELLTAPGAVQALASVRLITSATAPLAPADVALARELTSRPVWEGYGITESCGVVTSTLTTAEPRLGSVGRPLPGVQLRIVGQDGRDVDAAPGPQPPDGDDTGTGLDDPSADLGSEGEVGRIVVRSPSLFSGYWPDGKGGPGADGWFVTGDLGYQDDAGELRLVDRFAETISVSGFTVYPREVEDVLLAHPLVAQAAVVGVPGGNGQQVVAVYTVRTASEAERDTDPDPDAQPDTDTDTGATATRTGAPGDAAGEPGVVATPDAASADATSAAAGPAGGGPAPARSAEGRSADARSSGSREPAPGASLAVADLRAHVEAHLAQFKRPVAYQQVPTLPRTEVGRIDRPEVARDYVRTWGRNRPPQLMAVPPPGDTAGSGETARETRGTAVVADRTPEQVGDISQLGTRLPADGDRRHRGRRDTDDDLF